MACAHVACGDDAGNESDGTAGSDGQGQSGNAGTSNAGTSAGKGGGAGQASGVRIKAAPASGGGGEGGETADPRPNVVFVTSLSYATDEIGGISGADEKCATLAEAAGLEGNFVAWLSDDAVDAAERLGSARGFYNTRHQAFADEQVELLNGLQVFFPVRYDENGDLVTGRVATGSTRAGQAANTCSNWTSTDENELVTAGDPGAASVLWTEDFSAASCDESYHLYCFQIDHVFPTFPTPTQSRTVFVSSVPFTLGVEGRAAADELCAADAEAEGLSGTFMALLGTSSQAPLARFTEPGRVWVRPDGMIVADSTAALLAGPLTTPITQLANGSYLGATLIFGAAELDQSVALNCDDWTNPDTTIGSATQGVIGYTDERWHAAQDGACSFTARVICAQQ